jgi:hypothetical protein
MAQVEKESPWTQTGLAFYNRVTHSFHGTLGKRLGDRSKGRIVMEAEEYAKTHPLFVACAYNRLPRISYLRLNGGRCSTTVMQPYFLEIQSVLRHEEGHVRHSDSLLPDGPPSESNVQNYSHIMFGGDISLAAETHAWAQAKNMVLWGRCSHFNTFASEALRGVARRNNLSNSSPADAESLAYRIALDYAPSLGEAREISKKFKPIRKMEAQHARFTDVLRETANIMFASIGELKNAVYQTGRSFLLPFLDHKTEMTAIYLGPSFAKDLKLEGGFWNEVRQEISWRDRRTMQDAFTQKARDMRLLGQLDRHFTHEKRLAPEAYRDLLPRLRRAENDHAAKIRRAASDRHSYPIQLAG